MVVIEAFIKPHKLDDVKEALEELGVGGMTVVEVMQETESRPRGRAFGTGRGPTDLVPKIRLEIAVPDGLAERIIEAICLHGSSGKTEEGKILVTPIHGAVRIRTGEADEEALSI
ncbi:MAG: P-II family nitrogen regulator [Deltaproteobacteria bacterium]|nr:P-II family nitrogen regulator [Deltaproteobacteria bacterium]